jgi:energy-coupling factor transport system permease protein
VNEFEFLRNVPVGQYLPTGSIIHRLDPRTKLIIYFALILALTLSTQLSGILLGLIIVMVSIGVARIPYRFALHPLVTSLPLIFFLMVLQILLSPAPPGAEVYFSVWRVDVNSADVRASLVLLFRFMALILTLGLVSYTLSTSEIISGLNRLLGPFARIGLPVQDFAMIVQVTMRFLPLLAQVAERIAKAQVSRGADWDTSRGNLFARLRQMMPLLVPLFLISLQRAENMALAMDARSYGSSKIRSTMAEFHFRWYDGAAICLTAGIVAMILQGYPS